MAGQQADITLTSALDLSGVNRDIANAVRNAPRFTITPNIALGSFSRQASEFQRSLQASSARVLAFSLTASQIFLVTRGFQALIKATVDVEKQLTDINSILGLSQRQLSGFSKELFRIANETGQSFKIVSEGAVELSRQGLSAQETLKRLKDALTLTRLSGLSASDSVTAITTALNGFNDVALDSTIIVNKLATVDAAFAVSSKDLADALQRVGSTAKDTGTSFDELLGLVTAAKQITGREGSVIGNSLKTIFQRIERPEVLDNLKQLNVLVEDTSGTSLSAIQILTNLAKTYDKLSSAQQNQVVQLSAGVFQANQFRAILQDLGQVNSIAANATKAASAATDQAARRQAELNTTLSANINATINNLTELASKVGTITLEPALRRITSQVNELTGILGNNTEGAFGQLGSNLGEGILKGIGNYLSGPGLALGATLLIKLTQSFAAYAAKSLVQVIEVGSGRVQQEQAINNLLAKEPALYGQIIALGGDQLRIQQLITNELIKQAAQANKLASVQSAIRGQIGVSLLRNEETLRLNPVPPRRAAVGFIPSLHESIGALEGGYQPGAIKTANIPRLGQVIYNTAEKVKYFPGLSQPAIIPPQSSKAGINYNKSFIAQHGFSPYKAEGLVPNFADLSIFKELLRTLNAKGIGITRDATRGYASSSLGSPIIGIPKFSNIKDKIRGYSTLEEIYSSPLSVLLHESGHILGGFNDQYSDTLLKERGANTFARDYLQNRGASRDLVDRFTKIAYQQYSTYSGDKRPFLSSGFSPSYNKGLIPNFMPQISLAEAAQLLKSKKFESITYRKASGETGVYNQSQWRVRRDKLVGAPPPMGYDSWTNFDDETGTLALHSLKQGEKEAKFRRFSLSGIRQIRAQGKIFDIASKGLVPNFVQLPQINLGPVLGSGGFKRVFEISSLLNSELNPSNLVASNPIKKEGFRDFSVLKLLNDKRLPFIPKYYGMGEISGALPTGSNTKLAGLIEKQKVFGYKEFDDVLSAAGIYPETNLDYQNQVRVLASSIGRGVHGYGLISGNAYIKGDPNRERPVVGDYKPSNLGYKSERIFDRLARGLYHSNRGQNKLLDVQTASLLASGDLSIIDTGGIFLPTKLPVSNQGLIPSFNSLSSAIHREHSAGIPLSQIRVGRSPTLSSGFNPLGLGVYNTRDEPGGLHQGINRVAAMGLNPKMAGIPNYADAFSGTFGVSQEGQLSRLELKELNKNIDAYSSLLKGGVGGQKQLELATISLANTYQLTGRAMTTVFNTLKSSLIAGQTITNPARLLEAPGIATGRVEQRIQSTFGRFDTITQPQPRSVFLDENLEKRRVIALRGSQTSEFEKDRIREQARNFRFTEYEGRKYRAGFILPSDQLGPIESSPAYQRRADRRSEELRARLEHRRVFGVSGSEFLGPTREDFEANQAKQFFNKTSGLGFKDILTGNYRRLEREAERTGQEAIFRQNAQQRLQNKALTASFVLPVLGGVLESSIGNTFGDTKAGRGAARLAGGLTNIASFGATGFAIGGVAGGAVGAGLGVASELPTIIKAFSDTLPDLQRRLENITQSIGKTSIGFQGFIDAQQKLQAITAGDANATIGQQGRLLSQQGSSLSQLSPQLRRRALSALESGGIAEVARLASIQGENDSNLSNLTKDAINLRANAEKSRPGVFSGTFGAFNANFENLKSTISGLNYVNPFQLGGNGVRTIAGKAISNFGDVTVAATNTALNNATNPLFDLINFGAKKLGASGNLINPNLIGRGLGIDNSESELSLVSQRRRFARTNEIDPFVKSLLNLSDENGKGLLKSITPEDIRKLQGATGGGFDSTITALQGLLSSKGIKGADKFGQNIRDAFQGDSEGQAIYIERVRKDFTEKYLKDIVDSEEKVNQARQKNIEILEGLNKKLINLTLSGENAVNKFEINVLNNLSDKLSGLDTGAIGRRVSSGLSSISGGDNAYLKNFLDLQNNLGANSDQARKSQLELQANTQISVVNQLKSAIPGLLSGVASSDFNNTITGELARTTFDKTQNILKSSLAGYLDINGQNVNIGNKANNLDIAGIKELQSQLNRTVTALEQNRQVPASIFQLGSKLLGNNPSSTLGEAIKGAAGQEELIKGINAIKDEAIKQRLLSSNVGDLQSGIISDAEAKKNIETFQSIINSINGTLNDFDKQLSQTESNLRNSNRSAFQNFSGNRTLLNRQFEVDISKRNFQGDLSSGLISGVGGLRLDRLTAGPLQQINIDAAQRRLATDSNIFSGLNQRLGIQVSSREELESRKRFETNRLSTLTYGGEEYSKQFGIIKEIEKAQNDIENNDKDNAATKEQQTAELQRQLALTEDIVTFTREQNQQLARAGNFNQLLSPGQLGKTFTEPLQSNVNDFWNDATSNLQDFSIEFKQTFKDIFREGIREGNNFGDVLKNKIKELGYSVLGKATDQATNVLFSSIFGSGKEGQSLGGGKSGLVGAIGSLFNAGGLVGKYAKGGFVNLGSGTKDDVPALLSGGEFVINKRSTSSLGLPFLNSLNAKRYASGGEAIFNLLNEYKSFGDVNRPTSGILNVSPYLSALGQTDTNNPQNALKFARQQYFIDLAAYNDENNKILKNYENQQTARRLTAYISAGINVGGATASSFGGSSFKTNSSNTTSFGSGNFKNYIDAPSSFGSQFANFASRGGLINKYGTGGGVFGGDDIKDIVPAYLMGGEFVFSRNAANKIGLPNLNYMNKTGRIPGFAAGGSVGDYSPSRNYESDPLSSKFDELISISSQIRDNSANKNTAPDKTQGNPTPSISIVNQITVTITDNGVQSSANTQLANNNNEKTNNSKKQEQGKELGDTINQIITKALLTESKDGGILYNTFKKR